MNASVIAEIEKESARLKSRAKLLDEVVAAYKGTTNSAFPVKESFPAVLPARPLPIIGNLDYSKMTQASVCYDILVKSEIPLSRERIFEKANAGGAGLKHVDNLSAVLSRDSRFKHIGKGLWTIANEQPNDLLTT